MTCLTAAGIKAREDAGAFPKHFFSGPRRPKWSAGEVNAWMIDQPIPAKAFSDAHPRVPKGFCINEAALVRQAPQYNGRHMNADRLRSFAVPVEDLMHGGTGIYFLWRGDTVVYVGQTRTGYLRIASHLANSAMAFDAVGFMRCDAESLDAAERAYLDRLLPEYNTDPTTMKLKRRIVR
ncbi:hypothetical protein K9B33_17915 [Sphingobium sp. 3R8]|uniref:hypothetical protein n=1 Tax=Sphingobium sp. 3R8 TaxID=2874921 RepID=UPI001CCFD77A|nr:hypothetical protein [Sphingobium sp. 3R8]MBZ9649415.1 hypothetical protein [Sphingobium sp. 3R8]